ncbi:unnamed protein product [Schistosoma turkestanicum]|nr:unnamed protein product [Schistosoma turkestanicum]
MVLNQANMSMIDRRLLLIEQMIEDLSRNYGAFFGRAGGWFILTVHDFCEVCLRALTFPRI